jgi:hypothetical protein
MKKHSQINAQAGRIQCTCDAMFSGMDDAEWCARGAPSCSCFKPHMQNHLNRLVAILGYNHGNHGGELWYFLWDNLRNPLRRKLPKEAQIEAIGGSFTEEF